MKQSIEFKIILGDPDGFLQGREALFDDVAAAAVVHSGVKPFKMNTFDFIFFFLLPDRGKGVAEPQLGPAEVQSAVFDKAKGIPGGFIGFTGKSHDKTTEGQDTVFFQLLLKNWLIISLPFEMESSMSFKKE